MCGWVGGGGRKGVQMSPVKIELGGNLSLMALSPSPPHPLLPRVMRRRGMEFVPSPPPVGVSQFPPVPRAP